MTEDYLTTELSTGEEVPVRRVGEMYIVGYDHIPAEEFMQYVSALLTDEGSPNDYDEEDVSWHQGTVVDFGEYDGIEKIRFNLWDHPYAFNATILECW